jgi:hypothetical protein
VRSRRRRGDILEDVGRREEKVRSRRRRYGRRSRMKKREKGSSKIWRMGEGGRLDERGSERGRRNAERNEDYEKMKGKERKMEEE